MVITAGSVRVPPDSGGSHVDCVDVNTAKATPAKREVHCIGGPNVADGVEIAPVSATSGLKVDLGADNDVVASQGAPAAGVNAWPIAVINTANVIVKPGDAGNNAVRSTIQATAAAARFPSQADHTRNQGFSQATCIGGELDDTAPTAATEGDVSPLRITAQRSVHVNLRNNAGAELGTVSNPVRVDPIGTTPNTIQGDVAHDDADSGDPVKIGGIAKSAVPGGVADGDRVQALFDLRGRQIVNLFGPRAREDAATITLTSASETTLIGAGAAGVFKDLVMLIATNSSSSQVLLHIRDATGGAIRFTLSLAANGGGAVIPFNVPLSQTTAANNWTAQLSTGVSDVRVFAQTMDA